MFNLFQQGLISIILSSALLLCSSPTKDGRPPSWEASTYPCSPSDRDKPDQFLIWLRTIAAITHLWIWTLFFHNALGWLMP